MDKERELYEKVKKLSPETREKYLEIKANEYLLEHGVDYSNCCLGELEEDLKCPFCKVFSTEKQEESK